MEVNSANLRIDDLLKNSKQIKTYRKTVVKHCAHPVDDSEVDSPFCHHSLRSILPAEQLHRNVHNSIVQLQRRLSTVRLRPCHDHQIRGHPGVVIHIGVQELVLQAETCGL